MTRNIFALAALALVVTAVPAVAQNSGVGKKADPAWVSWNADTKTATLKVVAGLDGTKGALNFNGFVDGELVFTVPLNSTVVMDFVNKDGMLPHSAVVLDYPKDGKLPNDGSGPYGIQRAYSAKPIEGLPPEGKDRTRFAAKPEGTYMIYCGVPGHGPSGMYVTLVVSKDVTEPTVSVRKAGAKS